MASFYADHDIAAETVSGLRQFGHEVTATRTLHYERASDARQLWIAANGGWTLITHNASDYRLLHEAWHLWGVGRTHAGILVIPHWNGLLREWTPGNAARVGNIYRPAPVDHESALHLAAKGRLDNGLADSDAALSDSDVC